MQSTRWRIRFRMLQRELYFPFLEKMMSELNKHFSDQACEMMSHAAAFHPRNLSPASVPKIEAIAKFYKLDSNRAGQQFLLFSRSQYCREWIGEYDRYQKDLKERKDKGKPWICLPSLLDVFSKNDLHNLYADLLRVITIVATCLLPWHHVNVHTAKSKSSTTIYGLLCLLTGLKILRK